MDVSSIVADFGAVYQDRGQTAAQIMLQTFRDGDFDSVFTIRNETQHTLEYSTSQITTLLQGYQPGWQPYGAISLKPSVVNSDWLKVDFDEKPYELWETWIGFMRAEKVTSVEWPFVKWLVERHIVPMIMQDLELSGNYLGVKAAATPGTPNPIGTAMDGFGKVLADRIATPGNAEPVLPIVMGPVQTTPQLVVEYVEDYWKQVPLPHRNRPHVINMNHDQYQMYKEGYDLKYNVYVRRDDEQTRLRYFPNVTIKGHDAMGTSDRMFASPKQNLICLNVFNTLKNKFKIEEQKRDLSIYTDFRKGYGIWDGRLVFCTDQA